MTLSRYLPTASLFAIGLVATFLSLALLSHAMTLSDFGAFTVLYNAGTILSGVGSLGFDLSTMRFIPSALASGNKQTAKIFDAYSLRLVLCSSALVGVATILYISFRYQYSVMILIFLGISVTFWTLVRYISGSLRAHGHTNVCLFIDRILRDGGLALIGGCIILNSSQINLQFSVIVLAILSILGSVIGSFVLGNYKHSPLANYGPIPKIWLSSSIGLLAVNVSELLGARIDIFLAGILIDAKSAGTVALLLALTSLVTIPSSFLNVITMPMIAHHQQLGNYQQLRKLLISVTILAVLGSATIAAFLVLERDQVFGIFSKEAMALIPSSTFFLVLTARVFSMISHAMAPLLMMTGGERKLIGCHLISIVVKLILCSFFLSNFNISTIGILITSGTLVLSVLQIYFGISQYTKMLKTVLL